MHLGTVSSNRLHSYLGSLSPTRWLLLQLLEQMKRPHYTTLSHTVWIECALATSLQLQISTRILWREGNNSICNRCEYQKKMLLLICVIKTIKKIEVPFRRFDFSWQTFTSFRVCFSWNSPSGLSFMRWSHLGYLFFSEYLLSILAGQSSSTHLGYMCVDVRKAIGPIQLLRSTPKNPKIQKNYL